MSLVVRRHPRFRFWQVSSMLCERGEWGLGHSVPREAQDITSPRSDPIWVGSSDVESGAPLMGHAVSTDVRAWLARLEEESPTCHIPVWTMYHGTHAGNAASIAATGLRHTWGMLGTGAYVTPDFARVARRYALRDAKYALRKSEDSLVVRVYVPAFEDMYLERGLACSYSCGCGYCNDMSQSRERRHVCDHADIWRARGFLGAWVSPESAHGGRTVRSTEYCLDASLVSAASMHWVDGASATHQSDGSYNPHDALLRIL